MKKLDFSASEEGMCYGLAGMGMQAFLAKDLKTYDQRLAVIQSIPPAEISKTVALVQEKVKAKQVLNLKEESILSIPAFFNGIMLYQQPENYFYLFEEKQAPTFQNAELTFPRVLSKALIVEEKIANQGKPYIIEKNNVAKVTDFSGIYNRKEFKEYLTLIRETAETQNYDYPIGFLLSDYTHTATVGYENKAWQWINASCSKEIKEDQEMANIVIDAFSPPDRAMQDNNVISLSTEIFVENPQNEQIKKYITAYKTNDIWKKLHAVNQEKISRKDTKGTSWIFIAVEKNHIETVKLLRDGGAPLDQALADGTTLLYIAAEQGHTEIVKLLLEAKVNPHQSTIGITPLWIATQNGHLEVVKLLLEAKADFHQAARDGRTPLCIAIEQGHTQIVEEFLAAKININQSFSIHASLLLNIAQNQGKQQEQNIGELIRGKHKNNSLAGITALHMAALWGHTSIVKLLLDNGAAYTIKTGQLLPRDLASAMGYQEIILMFDSYNESNKNKVGSPPLLSNLSKSSSSTSSSATFLRKRKPETNDDSNDLDLRKATDESIMSYKEKQQSSQYLGWLSSSTSSSSSSSSCSSRSSSNDNTNKAIMKNDESDQRSAKTLKMTPSASSSSSSSLTK